MFRKPTPSEIDSFAELIISEAEQGRFQRILAQEPARSHFRQHLSHIRKKERRLDEDVAAQILTWEEDNIAMGCFINSAIRGDLGNEIWATAVFPKFRGKGIGTRMRDTLLAYLHPRTDVFSRCAANSTISYEMNLRRGFELMEVSTDGGRLLRLQREGSAFAPVDIMAEGLPAFIKMPIQKR